MAVGAAVDLGMLAAAQIIVQNDSIGVGSPHGESLRARQREHVAEAVFCSHHEIGCRFGRHSWLLSA